MNKLLPICSFCRDGRVSTRRSNFTVEGASIEVSKANAFRGHVRPGALSWGSLGYGSIMKTASIPKSSRIVGSIGGECPTNGAADGIAFQQPYSVEVTVKGVAPILFHRWNCESVQSKADAKKGSKEKKTDDVESYVYRNGKGELAIPGEYLRGAIVGAAKFQQDPRSPRKSAADLFKAAIVSMTPLASLGVKTWDYLDKRRVVIQRNAITRSRPAMAEGWQCTFILMINLPDYIDEHMLNSTIQQAGRLIGLADFRPSYGRFLVTSFKRLPD